MPADTDPCWVRVAHSCMEQVEQSASRREALGRETRLELYSRVYGVMSGAAPGAMVARDLYQVVMERLKQVISGMVRVPQGNKDPDQPRGWLSWYLDQRLIRWSRLPSLSSQAWSLFQQDVVEPLEEQIVAWLVAEIAVLRSHCHGEPDDKDVVAHLVQLLRTVDPDQTAVYDTFHGAVLRSSFDFYSALGDEYGKLSLFGYLEKVSCRLEHEHKMVYSMLSDATQMALRDQFRALVLMNQSANVFDTRDSEWAQFFCSEHSEYMNRLYQLYQHDPSACSKIASLFKSSLSERTAHLLQQYQSNPSPSPGLTFSRQDFKLVNNLLEIYHEYLSLAQQSFRAHPALMGALEEALRPLLLAQLGPGHMYLSQALAHYCDVFLSPRHLLSPAIPRRLRRRTDMLSQIDLLIGLLAICSDFELFMKEYALDLSRRLLSPLLNESLERAIISKLRYKCASRFTSRLERMLADISKSHQICEQLQPLLREGSPAMQIKLLTRGLWPALPWRPLEAPPALLQLCSWFESVFSQRFPRRVLSWQFGLGQAVLVSHFTPEPYELHVSIPQASILHLFNVADRLSFVSICDALNIPHALAKRLLHSLSCGRFQLLLKHPASPFVGSSDEFSLNLSFHLEQARSVRLPSAAWLQESQSPTKDTDLDPGLAVQAAIVRLMKRHRELSLDQLVHHLTVTLHRFKLDVASLQPRLDNLIENEYLEQEGDVYRYIP